MRKYPGHSEKLCCCNYSQVNLSLPSTTHTHTIHAAGLLGEGNVQRGCPNLKTEQSLNEDRRRDAGVDRGIRAKEVLGFGCI